MRWIDGRIQVPERRILSLNWESGTNSVCFLLPVHPLRRLWALTQLRLQERKEQAGHLYFDGFELHSSQSDDPSRLELVEAAAAVASPSAILDNRESTGIEFLRRRRLGFVISIFFSSLYSFVGEIAMQFVTLELVKRVGQNNRKAQIWIGLQHV